MTVLYARRILGGKKRLVFGVKADSRPKERKNLDDFSRPRVYTRLVKM